MSLRVSKGARIIQSHANALLSFELFQQRSRVIGRWMLKTRLFIGLAYSRYRSSDKSH
jgi:hypothetical protein